MVNILIFGDLCPTINNEREFQNGESKILFGGIVDLVKNSDFSIVNLECPLTDHNRKLFKSGPNLKASKTAINAIKNVGFSIVSLANNHIMDYGRDGLIDTIQACKDAQIDTLGAGINLEQAKKSLIKDIGGYKIGLMAFADNEYNLAEQNKAGANGLDLLYSFDEIKKVKHKCDFLIVLYHSGIEHYQYPSPGLQRRCRKMAESGADLVVCQHSHCIGSIEKYNNAEIVYGQGNFLFSTDNTGELWNTGLVLSVELEGDTKKINYIPIQSKNGTVDLASESKSCELLTELRKRSEQISDIGFINRNFKELCNSRDYLYWSILIGFSRVIYLINKLFNNLITKLLINKKKSIIIGNILQCESHYEALRNVLHEYNKDDYEDQY